jgi:AbrB family looped-hinge helix DNA binding protein
MNRANVQQENILMALVRMLRGGQVTLPAEARKALRLQEGDYLDLMVNGSTLTLKPVQVVDRAEADRQLDQILSRVRYVGSEPEPTEDEVMETVVESIRAVHAAKHAKSRTR